MVIRQRDKITDPAQAFLVPTNATHRRYEALRAFFVEHRPSAGVARDFGYSPGGFRVMCSHFRHHPDEVFFAPPRKGPHHAPKRERLRARIVALRKQNLSVYDIRAALAHDGEAVSPPVVAAVLRDEGFARLPRRRDDERPSRAAPLAAAVADRRALDLGPQQWRTPFGGLFLFVPWLAHAKLEALAAECGFPGSRMIGPGEALRALLGLKLFGNARHSHVMSHVFDRGLAD
jgi:hypothetical protein